MPFKSIAKRILQIKGDASYADFAASIKRKTGKDIHPTTIQKIATGDRKPSLDLLEILAKYANIPLKNFFEENTDLYYHENNPVPGEKTPGYIRELETDYDTTSYSEIFQLPILGYVPAGGPIMVEENIEGHIPLPAILLKSNMDFCLRIKGDSMEDVGINNGDLVLVHPQPTAENGQTVIARVDNEVTCKRFYKLDNKCRLEPANSKYTPLDCEDVEIIGVVLKVIKEVF